MAGLAGLSSAIRNFGVLSLCKADVVNGFGSPWGVVENMFDSGCRARQSGSKRQCRRGITLTTLSSFWIGLRAVLGVFPRSFPGVLKTSTTFLYHYQWMDGTFDASDTYIWFSEKTSAMCSLSHSSSFLAEYPNSSTSDCAIWSADDRSSVHHAIDPTAWRGGPGRIAMMSRRLEACNVCRNAKLV